MIVGTYIGPKRLEVNMVESEHVQTTEGEHNAAKPGQTPRVVPSMTTPGEEIANIEEAARCVSLDSFE